MRLFGRKSLEDRIENIVKETKDLEYSERVYTICKALSNISDNYTGKVKNQYILDIGLLNTLLNQYTPQETILHLAFQAKKLSEKHPDICDITEERDTWNGVI